MPNFTQEFLQNLSRDSFRNFLRNNFRKSSMWYFENSFKSYFFFSIFRGNSIEIPSTIFVKLPKHLKVIHPWHSPCKSVEIPQNILPKTMKEFIQIPSKAFRNSSKNFPMDLLRIPSKIVSVILQKILHGFFLKIIHRESDSRAIPKNLLGIFHSSRDTSRKFY